MARPYSVHPATEAELFVNGPSRCRRGPSSVEPCRTRLRAPPVWSCWPRATGRTCRRSSTPRADGTPRRPRSSPSCPTAPTPAPSPEPAPPASRPCHVGRNAGEARADYDARLADVVAGFGPDFVVLAGWMRILTMSFLGWFPDRVVNLHPALPGELPGTHAIERAWQEALAGERTATGVMVHLVPDEGVDDGPVLATRDRPDPPRRHPRRRSPPASTPPSTSCSSTTLATLCRTGGPP